MLPKAYGGGGLSNVDSDRGRGDPGRRSRLRHVLVNGLGPDAGLVLRHEDQKQRFIGGATSDPSNEFIVGYAASEPAGSPGGTANFDAPPSAARAWA